MKKEAGTGPGVNMVQLTPFCENDFDRFRGWIKTETFMIQFAGPVFTFPVTTEQLKAYVNVENRKVFKAIETESERVIGHGEINKIDMVNKNARLCRILVADRKDRNKGYGRAIIKQLLYIGFTKLMLHRIDLGVFEFNKQAIKCYEQCGFTKEGIFRESFLINNVYESVVNMSILKREWQKHLPFT